MDEKLNLPIEQDEKITQSIQKNLIKYKELNQFQKIVLSLVSGLSATKEEIEEIQKEFLRLDKDNRGTLSLNDIKKITESEFGKKYKNMTSKDWEQVIQECDMNGDGVIDF